MRRFALESLPDLYRHHIIDPGKQPQLFVLIAFLVTFVLVRILTHTIRSGRQIRFVGSVRAGETHVHHLVPGISLLLIAGYLGIALRRSHIEFVAIIFGIGAALTLDEFALWLHLRDVYWEREGRRSIDAVIIVTTILGVSVIGGSFFAGVFHELLGG
ncbi:MAG TPA: hypothetical protein VEZ14_14150 [Dehalococcoidia bacterium]|nr:hypothetical protein [Dehalococcoidia bacterium]